ncbi:MAG: type II toxin-antitoxin system RelE/ParE family toxin [Tunicatimonas sp.]
MPAKQLAKIRLILTRLDASEKPEQMNVPGYRLHALSGDLDGFYSVRLTGNYRIIFQFNNGNATSCPPWRTIARDP